MYAANAAYSLTGGDDKYFKASNTENLGANVSIDKSKFLANNTSDKMGRYVNTNSQFVLSNEKEFKTEKDLVNQ